MNKYDLSILVPSRCEMFLKNTVDDILKNKRGKTEIIVALDGVWSEPPLEDHPDLTIIYFPESIGQRAAINQCARLSNAKYVAKADAHTAFDEGFDVKMIEAFKEVGDNVTMVPIMKNLWVFDWVCPDGHRRYQGPSGPCIYEDDNHIKCGKPTTKDVVWIAKQSPQSKSYCFDSTPHFNYFAEYCKRPEYKKDLEKNGLTESMSLQGSFFMLTREKYWELNVCDENIGSWGSQGIEVAVKTWLSGGRVLVNHRTFYGHLFRTSGGDFSFPYHNPQSKVENAKKYVKELFFENKWSKQIYPSSWLIEKFAPVKGWSEEDIKKIKEAGKSFVPHKSISIQNNPSKGIIFYTDNQINLKIAHAVQKQLRMISETKGIPIVSASLKPMDKMGKNLVCPGPRGYKSYFTQILTALEASMADIIFMCEHDNLYHPSHFDFVPSDRKVIYYNRNWLKIHKDGLVLKWTADQVSGVCAYKDILIKWYKKRLETFDEKTFDRKFEPLSGEGSEWWNSEFPVLDIRHSGNLTYNKRELDHFRNKETAIGFQKLTMKDITGWGDIKIEDLF